MSWSRYLIPSVWLKQRPLRIDLAYLCDVHPSFNAEAQPSGFDLPPLPFCPLALLNVSPLLGCSWHIQFIKR